jgi:hypothetical protein
MVQITRPPTLLESASDVVQEGFERARGAIDTVAERAGEAVETIDVESVTSMGRDFIASLPTREPDRRMPIQAARDDERLKSAAIAGVVIFITSLIVFVLAREVAKRRAMERRPQAPNRPAPGTSPQPASDEG